MSNIMQAIHKFTVDHCAKHGVTISQIVDDNEQALIDYTMNLSRDERRLTDRRNVIFYAARLLNKKSIEGYESTLLCGVLTHSPIVKTFEDVFAKFCTYPQAATLFIDRESIFFTVRILANQTLNDLTLRAAQEVAFETLDITDLWVDLDDLMETN